LYHVAYMIDIWGYYLFINWWALAYNPVYVVWWYWLFESEVSDSDLWCCQGNTSLVSEKVVVFTFRIVLWELDLSTHLKVGVVTENPVIISFVGDKLWNSAWTGYWGCQLFSSLEANVAWSENILA